MCVYVYLCALCILYKEIYRETRTLFYNEVVTAPRRIDGCDIRQFEYFGMV